MGAAHSVLKLRAVEAGSSPAVSAPPLAGAFLALALASGALLAPALVGGRDHLPLAPALLYPWRALRDDVHVLEARSNPVAGDTNFIHLPDARFLAGSLARGELPLWNPWVLGGVPFLANALPGALYPGHLLFLLADAPAAFAWLAWLHQLVLGAGLLLFLRALGLPVAAALLGAATMALSLLVTARLHLYPGVETLAWLPWMFLGVERALAGRRLGAPLAAVAFGLSLYAGFPQFALLGGAAAALYALARGPWGAGLARAGAGLAAGALLAGAQVAPSVELAGHAAHGRRAPDEVRRDVHDRAALLGLVAPDLLGHPREQPGASLGRRWLRSYDGNNYVERALYVGMLPLLLALAPANLRDRRGRFFLALAAVGLAWAFGVPGVVELSRLPGFSFGSPKRAGMLAVFGLSVAAALGAARLMAAPARGRAWGALAWVAAALGAGTLFYGGPLGQIGDPWVTRNVALAFGLLAAALGALRLGGPALWIALTIADLGWFGARSQAFQARERLPDPPSIAFLRGDPGPWRLARFDAPSYLFPPDTASLQGFEDAQGYVPLSPAHYEDVARLIDPGMARGVGVACPVRAASLESPLWDLLGVKYLLSRKPVASEKWVARVTADTSVYENRTWLPRVFFVTRARRVPDDAAALRALADPSFDPRREVVLVEKGSGTFSAAEKVPDPFSRALLLEHRSGFLRAHVESDAPGFVVFSETWMPGWEARRDGRRVEVLRADHAFRAVEVPAGRSRIELEYRPWSFRIGLGLSLAGAAAIAALALQARR
jgi:hypothetical protein